ncbi:hypothetical protein FQN60_017042, partial [Etheostoma spectabile]
MRGDALRVEEEEEEEEEEEKEEEEERGLQTCPPLSSLRHRHSDRHRFWPIATESDPLRSLSPSLTSLLCALPTPAVSSPALSEPIRDWVCMTSANLRAKDQRGGGQAIGRIKQAPIFSWVYGPE